MINEETKMVINCLNCLKTFTDLISFFLYFNDKKKLDQPQKVMDRCTRHSVVHVHELEQNDYFRSSFFVIYFETLT